MTQIWLRRAYKPPGPSDGQRILVDSGVGSAGECERAQREEGSFGLFVRRLVGVDGEGERLPAAA